MSKTQINAGFIGVGQFINHMHLPHAFQNPKYCVHTLCDLDEDLLKQRVDQYKPLKTTNDYHKLLADPEIDVVFIGTKGDLHAKFIIEAANAGKNIMVEKPMIVKFEDAQKVVKAVLSNNVKLMVGYNRRFAPAMIEGKELYKKIKGSAVNIFYRMATDDMTDPNYYAFDLEKGGGHLVTEGCHILDLLCWFVDSEPVRIYAQGSLESDDNTTITFADGTIATFILSRQGGICYPKEAMEVYTGRSTMAIDQFCEIRADVHNDKFIRKFIKGKWDEMTEVPGFLGVDGGIELHYQKAEVMRSNDMYWNRKLQPDKGHYNELDAYAVALLEGKPSPVDEIDGVRATYVALMGLESIRRNQSVEIDPEKYFLHLRRK